MGRAFSVCMCLSLALVALTLSTATATAADSGLAALRGSGTQVPVGVAAVPKGFVAVGYEQGTSGDPRPAVWTGNGNGHTWRRAATAPIPKADDGTALVTRMAADAATGSHVVVVGSGETPRTDDKVGETPTSAAFWYGSPDGSLQLGDADNSGFVLPSDWAFGLFEPLSVTAGHGLFIAGGTVYSPGNPGCSRPIIWGSGTEGHTWIALPLDVPAGGSGAVTSVAYSPHFGFLAVGETASDDCGANAVPTLWQSDDGETWRQYTLPDGRTATGVAASNDLVVVMGVAGQAADSSGCDAVFWTSSDLQSWASTDDSTSERAEGATVLKDGSFVAFGSQCAQDVATHPLAYTLAAGASKWKPVGLDRTNGVMYAGAPKGGDGYVIVGTRGSDGDVWWT